MFTKFVSDPDYFSMMIDIHGVVTVLELIAEELERKGHKRQATMLLKYMDDYLDAHQIYS